MRIKGVSTFEQHVEKIVLISVSGIFLLVIALQLLVQPNTVTVGKGSAPPGRAYDPVASEAQKVRAKMLTTDFTPPDLSAADLVGEFRKALGAPVAPDGVRMALGSPIQVEGAAQDIVRIDGNTPIAEITVPAPTRPVANSFWSTIDPMLAAGNPEIAKILPAAQPFDKVAVSCEMRFDGGALLRALQADPDSEAGPIRALPLPWYRGVTEIIAVRLEREELTPTGEWTGLTEVPMPPGALNLQAEAEREARSQGDMGMWVGEARRLAEDVRRPLFYRTIAGEAWIPPSEARRMAAGALLPPEAQAEFRKLDLKGRDLENLRRALDRAKEPSKRAGAAPATGGGEMVRSNPRAGERESRDSEREEATRQKKIADAEAKVKKATDEIGAIENTIRGMGFDPETRMGVVMAEAARGETRGLLESPGVRLWAHDMTAEPGKTYRYRARVGVNNPVFGRAASLRAEQQELARRPVLMGEPSEWSDPVEVMADQYFFITSASEADELAGAQSARAELYRMFYGFYRKGTAGLEPGDAVASDRFTLPDPSKLLIWDPAKLKEAAAIAQPDQPPPAAVPGGEEIVTLPTDPRGALPQPDAAAAIPQGAKSWDQPIRMALDVVLLDVALSPAATEAAIGGQQGRQRPQAYLRDGQGRIIIRVPDDDRTSALYTRVADSSKKGESQGEPPKPKAEEPKPTGPRPPREPRDTGSGGGGGGGGGGG